MPGLPVIIGNYEASLVPRLPVFTGNYEASKCLDRQFLQVIMNLVSGLPVFTGNYEASKCQVCSYYSKL